MTPSTTDPVERQYEQSNLLRSDQGWTVLVNGFVRAIFPHGPHSVADAHLFAASLDKLTEENQ